MPGKASWLTEAMEGPEPRLAEGALVPPTVAGSDWTSGVPAEAAVCTPCGVPSVSPPHATDWPGTDMPSPAVVLKLPKLPASNVDGSKPPRPKVVEDRASG